jgi:hypothetical protein
MAQPNPNPNQAQISIELPADLEAVYSNFAIINHSPSEMVLDFARLLPNVPKAKIYTRIVMTPLNAKLLLQALQDNLNKYEEQFGEIRMPQGVGGFQTEQHTMGFKRS